jgi:glucokinase
LALPRTGVPGLEPTAGGGRRAADPREAPKYNTPVILAGDVGGTKTLLGLFDLAPRRPVPVDVSSFPTADFNGLSAVVSAFLADRRDTPRIRAACFGVAGPVVDQAARLTNVPWTISAEQLAREFDVPHVRLLNDLEAMAHAIAILEPDELHTLQRGHSHPDGNAALIAPGTGLGESILHNLGGAYRPVASEGGHADFAARNQREIALLQMLLQESGRVDLEQVVSGPGIVNLHRFTHAGERCEARGAEVAAEDLPPLVSRAAMDGSCARCIEAMDLYTAALGAAAGNLALRALSTGGVYIGGGVAPRILPLLEKGGFLRAFIDKTPMEPLLESMPVQVILNQEAALLGAATYASTMVSKDLDG